MSALSSYDKRQSAFFLHIDTDVILIGDARRANHCPVVPDINGNQI